MFTLEARGRKDPFSSEFNTDSFKWSMIGSRGGKHSGRSQDHAGSRSHGSSHSSGGGGRSSGGSSHSSDRGSHSGGFSGGHSSVGGIGSPSGGSDAAHGGMGAGGFGHAGGIGSPSGGSDAAHGGMGAGGFGGSSLGGGRGHGSGGAGRGNQGGIAGTGIGWGSIGGTATPGSVHMSSDVSGTTAFGAAFGSENVGIGPDGALHAYNMHTGQDLGRLSGRQAQQHAATSIQTRSKYGESYSMKAIQNNIDSLQHTFNAQEAVDKGEYFNAAVETISSWNSSLMGSVREEAQDVMNHPFQEAVEFSRTPIGKLAIGMTTGVAGLTAAAGLQVAQDAYAYANDQLSGQQAVGQALGDLGGAVGGWGGYALSQAGEATEGNVGAVAGSIAGTATGNMLSGANPLANALTSGVVSGLVNASVTNSIANSVQGDAQSSQGASVGAQSGNGGQGGQGSHTASPGFSDVGNPNTYANPGYNPINQYQQQNLLAQQGSVLDYQNYLNQILQQQQQSNLYGFQDMNPYGFGGSAYGFI